MKSFLQGKRTLDMASLRPVASPVHSHVSPVSSGGQPVVAGGGSPQIELVKQGDKIMRIIVTCTCGERTEIDCLYPPGQ